MLSKSVCTEVYFNRLCRPGLGVFARKGFCRVARDGHAVRDVAHDNRPCAGGNPAADGCLLAAARARAYPAFFADMRVARQVRARADVDESVKQAVVIDGGGSVHNHAVFQYAP